MTVDDVGEAFVRLGLSIGGRLPGYVDSYYGPAEIAAAVEGEPGISLAALQSLADGLAREVAVHPSLELDRREYLRDELAAMRTTIRILAGHSLDEEVIAYGMRYVMSARPIVTPSCAHPRPYL